LGALGKQFSEVVENADMKPFEGVTAAGSTWAEAVRFAILPQVLSNFASYGLLRFEINVRESAILGMVGAGGIGQELLVAVRRFYYSDVSAIVLMIIVTVAIIDMITGVVRHRLIGRERGP
jgi:phosphonate transport system permease protein